MAKNTVFVSFDWDNDMRYKLMLQTWDADQGFDFSCADNSSGGIGALRCGLLRKIKAATHTLVLVGQEANKAHTDSEKIGYKNWLNFQVAQSKANGKKLVAVQLPTTNSILDELSKSRVIWATNFSREAIIRALHNA